MNRESRGVDTVHERVRELRSILHGAGTVPDQVLDRLVHHASRQTIHRSAETGCGATTLLLSHLSRHHTVFALDIGGSVSNVRASPLLRAECVEFICGPSQRTLPVYQFGEPLQLALIDGPHAYPFPDLEYYYLYQHLAQGALLVLDDIHIRTIDNLFRFLKDDAMFQLDEVVRTTAFFTRTDAPLFDPEGDNWQMQRHNAKTIFTRDWRARVRAIPFAEQAYDRLKRLSRGGSSCEVKILLPTANDRVSARGEASGTATIEGPHKPWLLARRKDVDGWWPQGGGPLEVLDGTWKCDVHYGGSEDVNHDFEITIVVVGEDISNYWMQWVRSVSETGLFPPVALPSRKHLLADERRTVKRVK